MSFVKLHKKTIVAMALCILTSLGLMFSGLNMAHAGTQTI